MNGLDIADPDFVQKTRTALDQFNRRKLALLVQAAPAQSPVGQRAAQAMDAVTALIEALESNARPRNRLVSRGP